MMLPTLLDLPTLQSRYADGDLRPSDLVREILARIWDRDLSAGEIVATFALTGATISEHLAVLRRAGLVEMTKMGTSRRYRAKRAARSRMRANGVRQMIFLSSRSP